MASIEDLVYIDSTGYHFADYPAFLQWRREQYQTIYGVDVYLEPDSEDGELLAVQALADYQTASLGAAVYNSFSPVTSQGVGLSRNVKINGITRRAATYSTVDVDVVGQSGTVITNGVVIDNLEQKWNLPITVTIPIGGTITVTATSQVLGSITAAPSTVDRIFTPTLGWQTVNNASAATPGVPVETDAELRSRQSVSTANPSLTVLDGTYGGVANLEGVTKVKVYENDTDTTDGDGIPEHSICVVVSGGDDVEIAQEILLHKTPGCGTFGNTSELVYDAHGMPINIAFERPDVITIKVSITIAVNASWSSAYIDLIKEAVASTINAGAIGDTVFITKLFSPAYLTGTPASQSFDIVTLEIGKGSDPLGDINIPLAFNEQPFCDPATDVTVIVT